MNKDSTISLHTGNKMPIMALGTWQLDINTAEHIAHAIELGYPMIDTSSDYGTQPGIGEGLKKTDINRNEIYIVTKVEETDDAYERTNSNLKELQLDYIDMMLIHRPPSTGAGEELWKDLIRAKEDGLTLDIGVSNYSAELIDKLIAATDEIPTVNQIEWSPFGHSKEMKKYCEEKEIIIQAYSPLTRAKRLDDDTLENISKKYNKSPAQVLIRWNLQLGTAPLPKANKKEHMEENIDVFDFELSEMDMQELNDLNEEYSSLGSLPYI